MSEVSIPSEVVGSTSAKTMSEDPGKQSFIPKIRSFATTLLFLVHDDPSLKRWVEVNVTEDDPKPLSDELLKALMTRFSSQVSLSFKAQCTNYQICARNFQERKSGKK